MTVKFTEAIRRCMGWCPKRDAISFAKDISVSERRAPTPLTEDAYVLDGVIVDYRSTGLSIPVFILLVTGLAVIFQFFFKMFRPASSLAAIAILLAFIVFEVLTNLKKSRIAVTGETITFYRPFRKPVKIPRSTVVKAELKDNTVPLKPRVIFTWIFVMIIALYTVYTVLGHSDPLSISFIIVLLFFIVAFYHAYSRAKYAKTVVITTADKKVASIFTDDPGNITALLEVS